MQIWQNTSSALVPHHGDLLRHEDVQLVANADNVAAEHVVLGEDADWLGQALQFLNDVLAHVHPAPLPRQVVRLELGVYAVKTGLGNPLLERLATLAGVGARGVAPVGEMPQAKSQQVLRRHPADLRVVRNDGGKTFLAALGAEVDDRDAPALERRGLLLGMAEENQPVAVPSFRR